MEKLFFTFFFVPMGNMCKPKQNAENYYFYFCLAVSYVAFQSIYSLIWTKLYVYQWTTI